MCACTYVYSWGRQRTTSCSVSQLSVCVCVHLGVSQWPENHQMVRLAGLGVTGNCLAVSQDWFVKCALECLWFTQVLETKLGSPYLPDKYFMDWALSQAPEMGCFCSLFPFWCVSLFSFNIWSILQLLEGGLYLPCGLFFVCLFFVCLLFSTQEIFSP